MNLSYTFCVVLGDLMEFWDGCFLVSLFRSLHTNKIHKACNSRGRHPRISRRSVSGTLKFECLTKTVAKIDAIACF